MSDESIAANQPLPAGEYAVVEVLGHRTYVGRVSEVSRFGVTLMAIEPLFDGQLLPAVLIGGASLYQFTPVTPEVAAQRQPRERRYLPASLQITLPPLALTGREGFACDDDDDDDDPFAPDFLNEGIGDD